MFVYSFLYVCIFIHSVLTNLHICPRHVITWQKIKNKILLHHESFSHLFTWDFLIKYFFICFPCDYIVKNIRTYVYTEFGTPNIEEIKALKLLSLLIKEFVMSSSIRMFCFFFLEILSTLRYIMATEGPTKVPLKPTL